MEALEVTGQGSQNAKVAAQARPPNEGTVKTDAKIGAMTNQTAAQREAALPKERMSKRSRDVIVVLTKAIAVAKIIFSCL